MKLAALLVLVAGCATVDSAEGIDETGGKADGPSSSHIGFVQSNSPYYWAHSTYDEHTRVSLNIGSPALPAPIADADPLTARLQQWVDRIDAIVRAEVKASSGAPLAAPRPILKVLPSARTFNAWVSGTMACTGVGAAGAPTFLQPRAVTYGANYDCLRPDYTGGLDELRAFWARNQPACKLGADGLVSGAACEVLQSDAPGELEILATAQYIHVSTDLIATLSEPALVVIIAHELAHYYRAHASEIATLRYDFWYDSEPDRKKVPVPAANAAELQAQYAAILAGPQTVQAATPGRYSPRLRTYVLTAIAPLLAERTEATFVCAAARDALGTWTAPLIEGYGLPTDAMQDYLAFESKLAACASRLKLTGDVGAASLSYGTVLMTVFGAKLGKITLPFQGATLANVLDALNTRAVALDTKAARLVAKVQQNRIGL